MIEKGNNRYLGGAKYTLWGRMDDGELEEKSLRENLAVHGRCKRRQRVIYLPWLQESS